MKQLSLVGALGTPVLPVHVTVLSCPENTQVTTQVMNIKCVYVMSLQYQYPIIISSLVLMLISTNSADRDLPLQKSTPSSTAEKGGSKGQVRPWVKAYSIEA